MPRRRTSVCPPAHLRVTRSEARRRASEGYQAQRHEKGARSRSQCPSHVDVASQWADLREVSNGVIKRHRGRLIGTADVPQKADCTAAPQRTRKECQSRAFRSLSRKKPFVRDRRSPVAPARHSCRSPHHPRSPATLAGFLAAAHPKGAKLDDGAPCPRRI